MQMLPLTPSLRQYLLRVSEDPCIKIIVPVLLIVFLEDFSDPMPSIQDQNPQRRFNIT